MSSAALSISDTGFIDISRRHESIRLFVHPSVTLAAAIPNAVNESVVSIWIVDCPEDASHALLPAIPPALSRLDLYEDTSSRTRLVHELHAAGVQVVLSQYWLMECLRTGHVIPTELWEIRCSSQSRPTPCKYRQKIDRAHRISIMAQKQSDEENMPEPFCSPSNRQRGVPMPGARNGEVQVRSIRVKMEAVERPDVSRSRTESRVRSISTASTAGRKRRRTAESAVDADVGAGAVGGQDGLADDEEEEEDGEEEEQEQEQEQESDEEEEEEEQVGHEDVKIPIDMPPPRLSPPRQREWTADSDAVFALDSVEAGREHPRPAVSGRAARLHGQRDKVRFAWPIFTDRHPDELWSMYSYFLEYAQIHLKREEEGDTDEDMEFGMDPATGARVNALVEVPLNLELEITQVWAEIRRKYTRRNLDHLSIMLSSFRTARRHNLAPAALRAFYDAHTSKIRTLAGPYVPVKDRPPNFPWHDTRPVDPEGLVKWIPDWGQPGCAEFMGWDGQPDADIQDE